MKLEETAEYNKHRTCLILDVKNRGEITKLYKNLLEKVGIVETKRSYEMGNEIKRGVSVMSKF